MAYRCLFVAVLLAALATPVQAFNRETAIGFSVGSLLVWNPMKLDGIGFDYSEDEDFRRTRMLWLWAMPEAITSVGPVMLNGHYEFAFGQTQPAPQDVSFGFTPILEWQWPVQQVTAFVETGLGAHYLTQTENQDRQISTHFQFGEILGIGMKTGKLQFGFRFQHLSNGDIVKPNNGYNFYGVAIKYWY